MKRNSRRVRLTWAALLVWLAALVVSYPVAGAKNITDFYSLSLNVASIPGDSAVKTSISSRTPVVMATGGPPMNLGSNVNSSINERSPVLPVLGCQDDEPAGKAGSSTDEKPDQVLEWNQIFIETLIATNTPNSSSQRLGAIVHTAIFDAYNGIERRYTPVFVQERAPEGASRRAAVVAAAYATLSSLFPSQQSALAASYAASLAALTEDCDDAGRSPIRRASCTRRIDRGIAWGTEVAQAVLAWRATDGFNAVYPPFTGGTAIGQWRPTPPAFGPMSAQGLAFTTMFVLVNNTQFD